MSQSNSRFAFTLAKPDAELDIELVAPNLVRLWVGVPPGWISEEPQQSIDLTGTEARRIGRALEAAAGLVG